ncbi:hypothetical protein AMECASPLE_025969, partial [Ameca splendens]
RKLFRARKRSRSTEEPAEIHPPNFYHDDDDEEKQLGAPLKPKRIKANEEKETKVNRDPTKFPLQNE